MLKLWKSQQKSEFYEIEPMYFFLDSSIHNGILKEVPKYLATGL
jgi:hypothetical protein